MRTRRRPTLRVLALSALVCAVTACGGSTGAAKLSTQELISKANAACRTLNAGVSSVGATPSGFRTDPVVAARYLDTLKPVIAMLHTDVAKLVPPDRLKSAWTQYVSLVGQATQLLSTADAKAHAKDPTGLSDYNKANKLGPSIRAAAASVGATTCAGH